MTGPHAHGNFDSPETEQYFVARMLEYGFVHITLGNEEVVDMESVDRILSDLKEKISQKPVRTEVIRVSSVQKKNGEIVEFRKKS